MKNAALLTIVLIPILTSSLARADDPKLLAEDFTEMAKTVTSLGGKANFSDFQRRQKKALLFYQSFLIKHPESVYSNKVRWALYSAYLTLDRKKEALVVLDEIQDSLLQEFLRISFAQRNLGDRKGAGQILEGLLEKSEDGGVRARIAQFLWVTGQSQEALKILDGVIEDSNFSPADRAKALLVKAECYRGSDLRVGILETLANTYPNTVSAQTGVTQLAAARLRKGSDALPFNVKTVNGTELSLATLKGKAVLLYFWATYSYPSWRDIKQLKTAVSKIGPGNISVVAVSCESYVDRPKDFFLNENLDWHLVAEGNKWNSTLATIYDIKTLPAFVLIDSEGKIVTAGSLKTEELIKLLPRAVK